MNGKMPLIATLAVALGVPLALHAERPAFAAATTAAAATAAPSANGQRDEVEAGESTEKTEDTDARQGAQEERNDDDRGAGVKSSAEQHVTSGT